MDYNYETIELKDEINNIHTIHKDLFRDNFDYGYCITTFKSQGDSIPYKDYGIFDWDIIKKDGRQLYTVLSRIQDPYPVDINGKQIKPKDALDDEIDSMEYDSVLGNQSDKLNNFFIEPEDSTDESLDMETLTLSFTDW